MASNHALALDWAWSTTPATTAALVAGGAYSVAAVGAATALPASYALLVGGVGAAAQAGADLYQRRPACHTAARCAAWLATGGWTAVTLAGHTALTWNATGWWAAGTAAGMTLARGLVRAEQTARSERASRRLQKWANNQAKEWHERLARLFRLTEHEVEGVKPWTADVGYTVRVRMPSDTPELPADAVRKLAVDLRLPKGGGIQIVDGEMYGEIHIRVTAKDVLAETIDYPDDLTATSIYQRIELGLLTDAEPADFPLADVCALEIGQTGSGKSNLINVTNAQLLRTVDAVVWHLDVTGAGISLPWLRSWAIDGTSDVPLIDWTADTVEEAHIMLDVAIAGINTRKAAYQDLMHEVDDDKIPVSPDVPAIILVVDEIAELPYEILAKLDTVVDTGRAARLRTFISGLRATQDVITAAMKKQSRARIGLRVSDPEELHHLFPTGGTRLDPKAAAHKGSGFLSAPDEDDVDSEPGPFKCYRIKPKRINVIAPQLADRRPAVDAVTLDTEPGRYYASRWGRILPRLYKNKTLSPTTHPYTEMETLWPPLDAATGLPATSAKPDKATKTDTHAGRGEGTPARTTRFGSEALAALLETPRTATSTKEAGGDADESDVIRAEFGRVVQQAGVPADRPHPVPQLLTDAHNAVVAAGGRMHTADLAVVLDMERLMLGTELGKLLREVGIERPGKGTVRAGKDGEPKPGYQAETLAAAIRAYTTHNGQ
ncbi:hypothetical protein DY245_26290 [Streptomyces inhibens]|uniref:FtsK domain-containing protein n=1 Tax=Streptomyces inhibens TaxID=2293571 RepID=A0A371PZP5_STRIH|nr:hypothetical protein [Streptomyces inhibens]REK87583.1 hypothetical protein DY245_26290 [Streptomyces inhibens]